MSRFRFSLQALLDARTREEEERRGEFAAAARLATSDDARARLAREDFTCAARGFSGSASSLAPEAVREVLGRLALLEAAVRATAAATRRSEGRAALARDAYARARLERCRIEALRDRALAAFEREAERRETLDLDEANARSHNAVTLLASSFHN